ncbi:MAG: hypothetical protein WBW16_09475 [Bacteroidota bacterium]
MSTGQLIFMMCVPMLLSTILVIALRLGGKQRGDKREEKIRHLTNGPGNPASGGDSRTGV